MYPLVHDDIARQHIEDLRREAAMRRLVRSAREHKPHRRRGPPARLQRAPAR